MQLHRYVGLIGLYHAALHAVNHFIIVVTWSEQTVSFSIHNTFMFLLSMFHPYQGVCWIKIER